MKLIKTTLVGGIIFLIPVTAVVFLMVKIHGFMSRLAAPLAEWIPLDVFGGVALADLIALFAILVVCFLAGLLARRHERVVKKSGIGAGHHCDSQCDKKLTGGETRKTCCP